MILPSVIAVFEVSRIFIDGGNSLNLIYADTLRKMNISLANLTPTDTHFHGITPEKPSYPLGKILLDVQFGTRENFRKERLEFEIGKNVQVYIDDVIITTKSGSSLIDDLRETFDNLDKFRLKLNPTKCSFGVPAGEILGYLVSVRGIEANPEKIQAILTMRKPTKLKEI
ncbi:hypothetical protein QYE76_027732 [Lolium multiflorum]|uniref:Reverse transcriptase domain-containing protein n=1 Tax=Lolium multiflorum TaxID=4521 RepID=A0AAD8QLA0_LOLMU|nr:hypothetical protein QYE76_027732 [Lolium multiflorum]